MLKKIKALPLLLGFFFALALTAQAAETEGKDIVVVVDKKTNQLHVTNYNDGRLDILKSYHATMGQKIGDKLMEGDLKTPEGIYEFLYRSYPPQLKPIFGSLAVYIAYPNVMDKAGKKTGFDILLHGTDDPSRLEKNYDSKGCVVLDNGYVKEVSDLIKLRDTKIIITKDFSQLVNTPRIEKAKEFFSNWIKAWSAKDLTGYIEAYADEFHEGKMNRMEYAKYKDSLNKKYDTINVTASNVHYYFHEKYDMVTFTQHYKSTFKGGIPAYNGASKKTLYIQERNGVYRILVEDSQK